MKRTQNRFALNTILLATCSIVLTISANAQDKADKVDSKEFARQTIDIGVVVSDLERSLEFYTKTIGMEEVGGFKVDQDFGTDAGLTNKVGLDIKVLSLGKQETATKLKLMQVPDVKTKKADNQFIHSQFGFSYITIFVTDTNAAMARLDKAGVKPLAKGPAALPKSLAEGVFLTVVQDPDGNLVELVGPKAE